MTKEDFIESLEIYGANLERWPEDVSVLAAEFFESDDPDIVSAIRVEQTLDQMMDVDGELAPISVSLEASLIDLVPSKNKTPRFEIWKKFKKLKAPNWSVAGMVSASLIGGVSVGYAQAVEQAEFNAVYTMLTYASHDEYTDFNTNDWMDIGEES